MDIGNNLAKINIEQTAYTDNAYLNVVLAEVNNHVVRMSVMTEAYYWHFHPDSDESFLVTEGVLIVDLEDKTFELTPGELLTVPKNVIHRTRPKGSRSVNLTFERDDITTIKIDISSDR